jgi:hypothetical protein
LSVFKYDIEELAGLFGEDTRFYVVLVEVFFHLPVFGKSFFIKLEQFFNQISFVHFEMVSDSGQNATQFLRR